MNDYPRSEVMEKRKSQVIHQMGSAFKKSFQNMSDLLMKFVGINVLSIALFKDDFDFLIFSLMMIIRVILGGPSRFVEF